MTRRLPLLVLILGVVAATLLATRVDRGSYDRVPAAEEGANWNLALRAAQGEAGPAEFRLVRSPFYPVVLQAVASDGTGAVRTARRTATGIVLPLLALLVFLLLRPRTGPWPAALGGVAVALPAAVALSAGTLTGAGAAAVLILIALLVLDGRPGVLSWILAGLLVGVAAWFHALAGWSAGFVLLGGALLGPGRPPRWLAAVLAVGAWTTAAGLGAVVLGGGFVVQPVSGVEVHRGHRPDASGVSPLRGDSDPGKWRTPHEYRAEANRESGRALEGRALDHYWIGRGAMGALTAPHREALRAGVRTLSLVQADPVPRTVGTDHLRDQGDGAVLPVLLWAGRLLVPLGLAGILVSRRRLGRAWWMGLATGAVAFTITYADPETRLVTLCLLAGGFGLWLDALRRGKRALALGAGAAAVAVAGVLPWTLPLPGMSAPGIDAYYLGLLYQQEGRGSSALREFDRSLREDPENPFPRIAIAQSLLRDQVYEEAVAELETVRSRYPGNVLALESLARIYQNRQRWPEAIRVGEELRDLDPTNPRYANDLGTALLAAGLFQRAETAFRTALDLDPGYAPARQNLQGMQDRRIAYERTGEATPEQVVLLVRERRFAEADSLLSRAYAERGPDDVDLRFVEATLRIQQGRLEEAIALMEPLREDQKGNPFFEHNLAAAYAGAGRALEALDIWSTLNETHPTNEVFRSSLVRVRAQLAAQATAAADAGDTAGAVRIWEALVERFPDEPAYADSLAAARGR